MPRKLKHITTEHELDLEELPRLESGIVHWDEVFQSSDPLRIEIGVGNSKFLIEVAQRAPHFQYLGFEYCKRRVLKFLKKVRQAELDTIRMLQVEATRVLGEIIGPGSVDHFYVNHPDPWPKRRHAKHRLIRTENVRVFHRLLRPGGGISARTDSPAYAQQMLEVFESEPGLESLSSPGHFANRPLEPYRTPFEEKFRAQGKRIYYLEYRTPT